MCGLGQGRAGAAGRGGTRRGATAAREAGMQASGVAVKEEPGTEFLSAKSFAGSRTGYVFKAGARGLGYYRDRAHTAYVGSEAHARDVARPAPAAAPPAAVKQEPRAEAQRLRVEIPPAGRAGASEGLRSAVAQTPGLLTGRGTARQSKKREKKSREDERATDLAVLRQHVSHVADLAASVMHRLDGKRRRFDARRVQGEGEDWLDWTLEERGRFPQLQEEARAQARSTLRWDPARGWVAGASGHGEGGAGRWGPWIWPLPGGPSLPIASELPWRRVRPRAAVAAGVCELGVRRCCLAPLPRPRVPPWGGGERTEALAGGMQRVRGCLPYAMGELCQISAPGSIQKGAGGERLSPLQRGSGLRLCLLLGWMRQTCWTRVRMETP